MLAVDMLLEIEIHFSKSVKRILPVELDGETLRLILHLKDGGKDRKSKAFTEGREGHEGKQKDDYIHGLHGLTQIREICRGQKAGVKG